MSDDPAELRWEPTARQRAFLACPAYEALFGGSAGGAKTESLVIGALRWVEHRDYRALLLRRTFPELERDIIPLADKWYPVAGGRYHTGNKAWTFESGAVIEFGHLEAERDVHKYQGLEAQYIAFDELTTFTRYMYMYLLSRARSASGIPVRVRGATNPGGVGHEWVMERWGPWLDRRAEYKGPRAPTDDVMWYLNEGKDGQRERWVSREEAIAINAAFDAATVEQKHDLPRAFSRVFFRAKLSDNPHLMRNDPAYAARLRGLDPVTRAQLLDGDWMARPAAGKYFQRGWFRFVDTRPEGVLARVRRWDLASVEGGGDWTVGVRLSRTADGMWCIEDVVRCRRSPQGVKDTVRATAELDGVATEIHIPQDPGQAGKAQTADFAQLLAGYTVRFRPETGDKIVRAGPASAQVEAKNVMLVRAPWNEPFLQCLEAFPEGEHDDDVDAFAGAVTALVQSARSGRATSSSAEFLDY